MRLNCCGRVQSGTPADRSAPIVMIRAGSFQRRLRSLALRGGPHATVNGKPCRGAVDAKWSFERQRTPRSKVCKFGRGSTRIAAETTARKRFAGLSLRHSQPEGEIVERALRQFLQTFQEDAFDEGAIAPAVRTTRKHSTCTETSLLESRITTDADRSCSSQHIPLRLLPQCPQLPAPLETLRPQAHCRGSFNGWDRRKLIGGCGTFCLGSSRSCCG